MVIEREQGARTFQRGILDTKRLTRVEEMRRRSLVVAAVESIERRRRIGQNGLREHTSPVAHMVQRDQPRPHLVVVLGGSTTVARIASEETMDWSVSG